MYKTETETFNKGSIVISGVEQVDNAAPMDKKAPRVRSVTPRVSTNYVVKRTEPHWYALRTTYGRELRAYEYIKSQGGEVFCPTIKKIVLVGKKRKEVLESRLPNILFAYGTEAELTRFVYDNLNLPYLRFYYRHYHPSANRNKEPLIIPEKQMQDLLAICKAEDEDIIVVQDEIAKFTKGDVVRITDGRFKGVEGVVARFRGQQRVGIVIKGVGTVVTAYIPNWNLERIE